MRTSRRRFVGAAVPCCAVTAASLAFAQPAPARRDGAPRRSAPAASGLVTQRGEPFEMARLRGKTVVLNFIFTHCTSVCPTQTQALRRVLEALPEAVRARVHFVSVSIDPEHDSPAALSAFAHKQRVPLSHWTFVTGSRAAIEALSTEYSAKSLPEGAAPLDHRTEVRLIDAKGKLLQTYTGSPLDEARLNREIQTVDRLFGRHASR